MTSTIRLSRAARTDLVELWVRAAERDFDNADRLITRIWEVCRQLADHPESGRVRSELGPGLRSVPVGKLVVFYRLRPELVEVVRVLDGRRDLGVLF